MRPCFDIPRGDVVEYACAFYACVNQRHVFFLGVVLIRFAQKRRIAHNVITAGRGNHALPIGAQRVGTHNIGFVFER